MNILMVSANYAPAIGGPATSVPIIAEELTKLGHNVDVLTQGVENYKDEKTNYELIRTKEKFPTKRENTLQIIRLIMALRKKIKERCDKKNYDLIHAHDLNISSLSTILAGVEPPIISKFTGDLALEYYCKIRNEKTSNLSMDEFTSEKTLLKMFLWKLQNYIGKNVDLITAPSEFIKNSLTDNSNISSDKIIIFRNGAERVKTKNIKRDENKLFCALNLEPKKNVSAAIKAVKSLPKYKLVIAGDGSEKEKLKELVKELNIKEKVKFLGSIPHKKVIAHLQKSFAFILPSIYEPASVSLYDAMSTQTPIIATRVGGTPEIINDKKEGLLVAPFNPKRITEAVERLEDKNLYKKIQNNQKSKIKRYYWSNLIKEKLIPIYKEVINSKSY